MILELICRRATKDGLVLSTKKLSTAQKRHQQTLLADSLIHFAPKQYPCIFLDQRLRSRFVR